MLFEVIATACAALFAGAATYISAAEHPARLRCAPAEALAQWRPSDQRATLMQAPLAVVGLVAAVIAYWQNQSGVVLAGGLLLGAVISARHSAAPRAGPSGDTARRCTSIRGGGPAGNGAVGDAHPRATEHIFRKRDNRRS